MTPAFCLIVNKLINYIVAPAHSFVKTKPGTWGLEYNGFLQNDKVSRTFETMRARALREVCI